LATAPSNYQQIIHKLQEFNILKGLYETSWGRIIIEKPFGLNLDGAIELNKLLKNYVQEDQIFRIDHYLGKEAVQNLLVFRFANMLFNPVWNRKYIDHIQITVAETVGLDKRIDYFEQTGGLIDMVQSHLLQILAFLTMERPTSLDPDNIRDKKVELFRSIKKFNPEKVNEYTVRGQYGPGRLYTPRSGDHEVVGYREETGVNPESMVETFVALKLEIDNERWMGVPIYMRTGKRLKRRLIEVVIEFRPEKFGIFSDQESKMEPNRLILRLQPNPSINIQMGWKPPGLLSYVTPLNLNFQGRPEWELEPKAYERLLLDVMSNDKTLFIRFDEVEEQWRVIMPILEGWKKYPPLEEFPNYKAGSEGPKSSFTFIENDNRKWNPM
jgi:glucose-6-phosphate 1-dehydrogenase